MINTEEIYNKIKRSVLSSLTGFNNNFVDEDKNAYVSVNYDILSSDVFEKYFNWLLTPNQTKVLPITELSNWYIGSFTLKDLTGISENSISTGTSGIENLPIDITPQPELPSPSIISIDFEQLNPVTRFEISNRDRNRNYFYNGNILFDTSSFY